MATSSNADISETENFSLFFIAFRNLGYIWSTLKETISLRA